MAACRPDTRGDHRLFSPNVSAPGAFAQLAAGYRSAHGIDKDDLKRAMAHVSVKSHANGRATPRRTSGVRSPTSRPSTHP